jgi:hypothetical protein
MLIGFLFKYQIALIVVGNICSYLTQEKELDVNLGGLCQQNAME